ncbi:hypothetical protein pdam_00008032, partial [Pocillopora damicornis]
LKLPRISRYRGDEVQDQGFDNKGKVNEKVFLEDVKFERAWSKTFHKTEHLLLKVTYHPYWKCAVRYSAEVIDGAPDWHEDLLHHVTPSLLSIVLRPGNHHVIYQYKNPFIRR